MAIHHGNKSNYLEFNRKYYAIQSFITSATIFSIITMTLSKFYYYFLHIYGVLALIFFFMVAIPPFLISYVYFKGKQRDFEAGQKGEGSVYYELKNLNDDYFVFQDIKLQKRSGNIDFILLAPAGVFALEVKSNTGKISFQNKQLYINGNKFKRNPINQVKSQAVQVKEKLPGIEFVNPVLVFSSGTAVIDNFAIDCDGVRLINKKWLINYVASKPRIYSRDQLENYEKILMKYVKVKKSKVPKNNQINFVNGVVANKPKNRFGFVKKISYSLGLFI